MLEFKKAQYKSVVVILNWQVPFPSGIRPKSIGRSVFAPAAADTAEEAGRMEGPDGQVTAHGSNVGPFLSGVFQAAELKPPLDERDGRESSGALVWIRL